MGDENDLRARLVPAICTQCGAKLEVDPTKDAAVCQYCNTPFVVQKAVENYTVQQAKIEHVDTVKLDMKGTADSFFNFVGEQMSESRKIRAEERRERRAADREMNKAFIKIFGYMVLFMMIIALIWSVVFMIRGDSGEESAETTSYESKTTCYILPGVNSERAESLAGFAVDGEETQRV